MNRFTHDLDAAELRDLVTLIAADSACWGPLVHRDTRARHFEELHSDEHVGVWVISWASGNDTGFHDHDVSGGAVAVVEGEVIEERLVVGGAPRALHHRAGEAFDFDASHVHRMRHDAAAPAVPDPRLLAAAVADGRLRRRADGTLRRRSISYAEELRPVETAGASERAPRTPAHRSPRTRRAAGGSSRSRCHARPMTRGGSSGPSSMARTPGGRGSTLSRRQQRGAHARPRRARGSSRRRWSERRRAARRAGASRVA